VFIVASAVADIGVFVLFAFIRGLHTRDLHSLIAFKD